MKGAVIWPVAVILSVTVHAVGIMALAAVIARGPQASTVTIELSPGDLGFQPVQAEAVSETDTAEVETMVAAVAEDATEVTAAEPAVASDAVTPADDGGAVAVAVDQAPQADTVPVQAAVSSDSTTATPAGETDAVAPVDANSPDVVPAAAAGRYEPEPANQSDVATQISETGDGEAASANADVALPATESGSVSQSEGSAAVAADTSAAPAAMAAESKDPAATAVDDASQAVIPVAERPGDGVAAVSQPDASATLQPVTEPAEEEVQTALVLPRKPAEPPAPPPRKDDRLSIAAFVKEEGAGSCFLAVPRRISDDGAEVDGYAAKPDDLGRFQAKYDAALDAGLTLNANVISQAQCTAVELVRALAGDGESRLGVQIEAAAIPDGGELVAEIRNVSLPWFALFLVDDEGMAVDVSDYVTAAGGTVTFRAPVHLRETGRGRPQLLIALAASDTLALAEFSGQQPADDIFPLVMGEKRSRKIKTEIAIASFRIR